MTTFLPEEGEEVMFTNCADVPYEIKLSDEENFEVINRSSKFFIYFEFELRIFFPNQINYFNKSTLKLFMF